MGKIGISTLPPDKIDCLKPLVELSREKPYRFLPDDIRVGSVDSFVLNGIADLCREKHGEIFVAVKEARVVGMATYSDLPWDTRVIGVRMGTLNYITAEPDGPSEEIIEHLLDHIEDRASSRDIEFLLCKTYTSATRTIRALEKKGFFLMDTLLDYIYDSRRHPLSSVPRPPLLQGCTIRRAGEADVEEMVAVAQACFQDYYGRYHADKRIPQRRATLVYEEWMRSSCGGYADWILVAEIGGRIAGFSVWKKPSPLEQGLGIPVGHYSIGAIHPGYQGRGLFSSLTYAGMELLDDTVDYIDGPTHINNYAVQWAYAGLFWRVCDARHSFHKWLTG